MATSSPRAARAPTSPVCFMPATSRTAHTARPLRLPARVAWPPWKWKDFSRPKDINHGTTFTEGHETMIERISPPGVPAPRGPYSPAVRAGDFIFVAGQVALDPATQQLIAGDVGQQTRQVLNNINRILQGFDAEM